MKISTKSFQVIDDHGIEMVICLNNNEIDAFTAETKLKEFFDTFRIKSARKLPEVSEKVQEQIDRHQDLPEEMPTLAEMLPMKQRIYIIRKFLPEVFGHGDFENYVSSTSFNGGKYTEADARWMWKSAIAYLGKRNKVEIVNKGVQTRLYQYRYIGTDTLDEISDLNIKSLRRGDKIELSN